MALDEGKEIVATTALDAQPEAILKMPEDSILPLLTALVLTLLSADLLAHFWWLAALCGVIRRDS